MSHEKKYDLPYCFWGVVANVVDENPYGESKVIRHGVKYFRANQHVYCFPPGWGDGFERLYVLGRRRGRHGLICVIMPASQLKNFRAEKIYSPPVIKKILEASRAGKLSYMAPWYMRNVDRREVEWLAAVLNEKGANSTCSHPAPHQTA